MCLGECFMCLNECFMCLNEPFMCLGELFKKSSLLKRIVYICFMELSRSLILDQNKGIMQVDPAKQVMQHNAITSGKYDFDACQMDIMFMLLASLGPDDLPNKAYSIHLEDIKSITNRIWDYKQLYTAAVEIGEKPLDIKNNKGEWRVWWWKQVHHKHGEASIEITINESIRPFLFDLKNNFTKMQLKSLLACNSKYAKRLYGLCCQWRSVGEVTFGIDELKEMLGLKNYEFNKSKDGLPKETYVEINAFKSKVLEVAKKQINEKTDIHFDYKLIKRGRVFTQIKFIIDRQDAKQMEIDFKQTVEDQKEFKNRYDLIKSYGLDNEDMINFIINKKRLKKFEEVISELTMQVTKKKFPIPDKQGAYIVGMLKKKGILDGFDLHSQKGKKL